jgi:predicted transcriptional regulator
MAKKIMKIGVMSKEEYKQRTVAIAKGEYVPKGSEPKIWFESLQSMAQVLNNENQKLLQTIVEEHPKSLKELEELSGRSSSNLSRTLKTMARYGIIALEKKDKRVVPIVKASDFRVEFGLHKHVY